MARLQGVRTFIRLSRRELAFVRTLQRLVQRRTSRKSVPPLHRIIQAALSDYRLMLELGSAPDFLTAYERAKPHQRGPRSPANEVC